VPESSSQTQASRGATLSSQSQTNSAPSHSTSRIWIACLAAFGLGVAVMLMYQPFAQPERGDDAIWDYVAQCIVRGQIPYRDVIEIKTPGSAYLSGLAIVVGKATGSQDIHSIRLLCVFLVGILCAVTFLTAQVFLRSLAAGAIAVLVLLTWPDFAVMMISGTRPKVPMIIFGLLTLVLIAAQRPFWAGMCSMLSCLCWQPGLLFAGITLLVFSSYLTSWRDFRAFRALIGASVPLGLALIYFYSAGALSDFWSWTVSYNYQIYMPETRETAAVALNRLWYLIDQVTGGDTVWVKLGAAGLVLYAGERILVRFKNRAITAAPELFKDCLVVIPLMYLVFKVVSYPGADDLIPLFPFIGLFVGYAFTTASRWISDMRIGRSFENPARFARWIPIVPVTVLAALVLIHGLNYRITSATLQDQQQMVQRVSDLLDPDDKVYVHCTLELLVLLNIPNMNPYIFLDRGKDKYLAGRTPGGFAAIMRDMKSQAPKVIAISRLQKVSQREELSAWATEDYRRMELDFAHNSVYVRNQDR
jgi:hypothetical protein